MDFTWSKLLLKCQNGLPGRTRVSLLILTMP